MSLTTKYVKKYAAGVLTKDEEDKFFKSLQSIANLVIYRHFNNLNGEECDDARSEAVFGALKALNKPYVDFYTYDALHYVYTIMRHSIHNYFRKYREREVNISPELFDCADSVVKGGVGFDTALSKVRYIYNNEFTKSSSKYPRFADLMIPFEEAINRMDVVDSILLFRAFEQLREEPDDNITTIRDMLEQHRD